MGDATKFVSNNGGNLITDLKSQFSLFRTKTTIACAYGCCFAFIAFTLLYAFNPSPNSSSPLFSNIFSTSNLNGSSIFSLFFPNSTQGVHNESSFVQPSQTHFESFQSSTFQSPNLKTEPEILKNKTRNTDLSDKVAILKPKSSNTKLQSPSLNNEASTVKNQTTKVRELDNKIDTLKPNQSTIVASNSSLLVNGTENLGPKFSSEGKNDKTADKGGALNFTSSLLRNHSSESLVENLMNCDLFDGNWVRDESYPLYEPGSCSLIDEQFNCFGNGRPDKDYQKFKWMPKECTLPRLNGTHMLELLRGKRLVFVGDSLNRNMWESLVCILRNSIKDQRKVYEALGRHHFRGEASYSFIFYDYNCTLEFFVSPFLVQEWMMPNKNGSKKETLRLDLMAKSSLQYKDADIIIFNTGHWWTHEKTSLGKDYYQEGNHVYSELNALEAFRRALTTWGRWVDANINPMKTHVFFRGYSACHFRGGQWNSGGQCDDETEPIKNETYLSRYPPKMKVLESVLQGMKIQVSYLNITRLTDYRKDGHPSIYRMQKRRTPLRFQDCSHWCLPGVPDAWNELLYAEILRREEQRLQKKERT